MALFREAAPSKTQFPEAVAVEPPFRDDACTCGCAFFTPGGPVVVCRSNGVKAETPASGAVLSCLGCGQRWYQTPNGLRTPHESALPPAWAMRDMQERATAARERVRERDPERPHKRMAGPHEGFALPPKV